ncbi:MAG: Hsp70 family protein [Acidobacteriota bacterium]
MRFVHEIIALAILLLGAGAIAVVPRDLPSSAAADPAASPPAPIGPGDLSAGAVPPAPRSPQPAVHILEQDSPAIGSDDVLSQAVGVEMPRGAFLPVLEAGSVQPATGWKAFRTASPGQEEIRLHVLRGRSDRIEENHSLGWVRIGDLEPGPRGLVGAVVSLRIVDGNIVMAAVDAFSRRPATVRPIAPPAGR